MLRAIFGDDSIKFDDYPFRPSSVYKTGSVNRTLIRDIDLSKAPPEVRLITGEILFVPATQKKELNEFAEKLGIPTLEREDVWHDLLEPFLDTTFSISHHKRSFRHLQRQGFSLREIRQIRSKVSKPMWLYNGFFWDWTHLGLMDLLEAVERVSFRWTFKTFYKYAMQIANRASERAFSNPGG